MKRIVINILMTTLILCSSLNTWAYDFEAEGVYYNISSPTELTVEVTSGENAYRGEINLTHSVLFNGTTYQVTSIGERAFSNCDALTAITLPQNLKSIGKYAFNHCTSLYSIIIPETVTNINEGAFYQCWNLSSIHIPSSVISIGISVFQECLTLQQITVASENTQYASFDGVLFNKTLTTLVAFPEGKDITTCVFPTSLDTIGNRSFQNNMQITSITIPEGVVSISERAFARCRTLSSIYLPNSLNHR